MKNKKLKNNSVLVVGSVAFDDIETPFGKVADVLGGSATYFSLAACLFTKVNVVAVVGEDFPERYYNLFIKKGINVEGLEKAKGKTFHWSGYYKSFNEAITVETKLNVFENFDPKIPKNYNHSKMIFLANIHPQLQKKVLKQKKESKIIAADTMNHWIQSNGKELEEIYKDTDIVFMNEGEAKQFANEKILIKSAEKIKQLGPKWVIIKRGEYGVIAYNGREYIVLPAYPLEKIVDTTGAGDSFAGAFMGYLASVEKINDKSIRNALAYGTVVASFTVQGFGVEKLSKINRDQIINRLNEYKRMIKI